MPFSILWILLSFIVAITILVAVHEFGHFGAARLCGVMVERFSIGFGKPLVRWHDKKGTEFTIATIPLGGYVKMLDERVEPVRESMLTATFNRKTKLQRTFIIVAGPFANLFFAFFVYWVVFILGIPSYPAIVERIEPGSIISAEKISAGSELKWISGIKVSNRQDAMMALVDQLGKESITIDYIPKGEKSVHQVIVPIKDWHVNLEHEDPAVKLGMYLQLPEILPVVSKVIANSPAEKSRLKKGDIILCVDNVKIDDWNTLTEQIKASPNRALILSIERQGLPLTLNLIPQVKINSEGKKEGFAGIVPSSNVIIQKYGIFSALEKAANETEKVIKMTVKSFWFLLTGVIDWHNLSGPVSIAKVAASSASNGLIAVLTFLAFISISLGIINLFPLPVLDGGHLLLILIEAIKGKALSIEMQGMFYRVGSILLLLLMGLALFNDFSRL